MRTAVLASLLSFALPLHAFASCGSSSCPIDLNALNDAARFTIDESLQYIDQDQPRIGSRAARIGEIASDHDEIRTINRIAALQLGVRVSDRLQLSFTTPYVSRSHVHFDTAAQQIERWDFGARGDVLAQARYRIEPSLWLIGGVKLPTGARHETAVGGGDVAEVTIEPGTGSTDVIAGLAYQNGFLRNTALSGPLGHMTRIPYFASLTFRVNGHGTESYRRGDELQLNAGTEYPLTSRLSLIGQLNARRTAKDDVGNTGEDRNLTGGTWLYLSPGLRFRGTAGVSFYALVQLPAHQHVNGLQLTSRRNYVAGVHWQR